MLCESAECDLCCFFVFCSNVSLSNHVVIVCVGQHRRSNASKTLTFTKNRDDMLRNIINLIGMTLNVFYNLKCSIHTLKMFI